MNKRNILLSIIIGALVDGLLRLSSGDEGNLLLHSTVFLISAGFTLGVLYLFGRYRKEK
jgi:high-affinity Fe2+/Pb2+ permease